jgi:hypothetical protein
MTEDTEAITEPRPTVPQTTSPTSYQQLSMDEERESATTIATPNHVAARRTLWNFTLMSILFSANHGCVVGKKRKERTCGLIILGNEPIDIF